MTIELLKNEFCKEDWDNMKPTCNGKFCEVCSANLLDLSELPISEIVENHLGSGKCVRLTESQINFLTFYQRFRKSVAVSSILIGSSFFNYSYSQSIENAILHKDSCLITGRAIFDYNKSPSRNVSIYITAGNKTYETKTDNEGNFAINLPKNCTIQHSNLKKLEAKKIKDRNQIKLGKNKIHRNRRMMGWL
jgi:hypothetical protein